MFRGNIYEILNRIFKDLAVKYEVLDNRQSCITKAIFQEIIKTWERFSYWKTYTADNRQGKL